MYLKDIYIEADPELVERYRGGFVARFNTEVCCITEHYKQLIQRKIQTRDSTAVRFLFTDLIGSPPSTYGVHNCKWPFRVDRYIVASIPEKKRMIFDALHSALQWIAEHECWNVEPLVQAREQMLQLDLRFEATSSRSWISPSRSYRAKIQFAYDIDRVEFTALLLRARSPDVLAQKPIGMVRPHLQALDCASSAAWVSPTEFRVRSAPHLFMRCEWTIDFSDAISRAETVEG